MTLWNLLQDILVAVLLTLLISFVGITWIDYDDPAAWRVEGVGALECAYRPGRSSPWTIWPGPLCRQ
jgi:hypothetical protein